MTTGAVRIRLKQILEERGMSQAELARISGIPANSINQIVKYERSMQNDTIEKICRALNITPADLFGWDDPSQ